MCYAIAKPSGNPNHLKIIGCRETLDDAESLAKAQAKLHGLIMIIWLCAKQQMLLDSHVTANEMQDNLVTSFDCKSGVVFEQTIIEGNL